MAGYLLSVTCLAEESHEMSYLIVSEKCFKKLGMVLCGTLRANLLPILDCISPHEAFMILCFSYV